MCFVVLKRAVEVGDRAQKRMQAFLLAGALGQEEKLHEKGEAAVLLRPAPLGCSICGSYCYF